MPLVRTNHARFLLLGLGWALASGCDRAPSGRLSAPPRGAAAPAVPASRPDCRPRLQAFYRWYVGHRDRLDTLRYCLADPRRLAGAPRPYALDPAKQRAYVQYLAGSGYFAPSFLEALNRSLAQKGAYLRAHPQVDGEPVGFEADGILFTQDLDLTPATFRYEPTTTGLCVDSGENRVEFTFDPECRITATAFSGRSKQIE
jgi:hypothetical protein